MEKVENIEVLKQTIKIQSCLLEGHSIEAIFRNRAEFIFKESNADFFGLLLLQKESGKLEFMVEKGNVFNDMLKRYHLQKHTLIFDSYIKAAKEGVNNNQLIMQDKNLYEFLGDCLSKNKIKYFQENNDFNEIITIPTFSLENQLIGFLFFSYLGKNSHNPDNLLNIKAMVETVIRPFYDVKNNIFQSKFIQILNEVPLLTTKEKHILKKLLAAKSYAQIAEEMHVSVNTVKTHIKHIYAKYEVKSKLELANKVNSGFDYK
ncbi:LuxR C-terminal-related transcriptional regulator [Thiomicrorhabdus sp.]|uniref:LuxR C-terminal-related transcriptional regulator n=1 Tax=Thiomicrorhabdus sp. TaxID=2039724 RepID=UPI002AA8DC45|nr:LuxR C-terminal-related transcriptional regulator [Thiomicrorhabdus sp.]